MSQFFAVLLVGEQLDACPTNACFLYLRAVDLLLHAFIFICQLFATSWHTRTSSCYTKQFSDRYPAFPEVISSQTARRFPQPAFFEILQFCDTAAKLISLPGGCTVSPQLTSPISSRARFLFQFHLNNDYHRSLARSLARRRNCVQEIIGSVIGRR